MKRLAQSIFLLLLSIGIPLLIIRQFDVGRNIPYRRIGQKVGREIYTKRRPS
ncbi:MAG: hypothetical protein MI684_07040 [Chlorobiales bacterium]|nr:hypothetical protein [Chlorobiales bacterium]